LLSNNPNYNYYDDDYGLTIKIIDVRQVKADAERYGKEINKMLVKIERVMLRNK
jgi:hypothetical protein